MIQTLKGIARGMWKVIRLSSLDSRNKAIKTVPSSLLPFPQNVDGGVKLNVGGGKNHPVIKGWKVVDLRPRTSDYVVDIGKERMPFADGSVDAIFTSHVLEHIYPHQLPFVLGEFYRVLKPSRGLLRVSVPDIRKAVKAYVNKDYGFFARSSIATVNPDAPLGGTLASWFYSMRVSDTPDLYLGEGHVHCFDVDYLIWWLKQAGFRYAWESAYKQSILQELRQEGFDLYANDSLFVEAVK